MARLSASGARTAICAPPKVEMVTLVLNYTDSEVAGGLQQRRHCRIGSTPIWISGKTLCRRYKDTGLSQPGQNFPIALAANAATPGAASHSSPDRRDRSPTARAGGNWQNLSHRSRRRSYFYLEGNRVSATLPEVR
jgi:hypothetical protein